MDYISILEMAWLRLKRTQQVCENAHLLQRLMQWQAEVLVFLIWQWDNCSVICLQHVKDILKKKQLSLQSLNLTVAEKNIPEA